VVGSGRIQLDSGSALRVEQGFSGSPVFDEAIGRVVGIVAAAPLGSAERDSYAIGADRLRLAWPEVLAGNWQRAGGPARNRDRAELTILHVSDTQFGKHHLFGGNGLTPADRTEDTLFRRLHRDLEHLAGEHGLRPDLLVVTGDLAEWGLRSEFSQVSEFLGALSEAAEIPRRHVAIVPGNHDINRRACEAYFADQDADEAEPVPPFWPKWRQYAAAFDEFYAGAATFTPDEPWTLFDMPDLGVVVAGLNSTMAESHREEDHYGWIGEHQLDWFARRLASYRDRGWLRLAAVHHNAVRGAVLDDENLRDVEDLDRLLGQPGLVNLLLHGHTHDGKLHWLPSGLPVLSTGSAAVEADARPAEVPNQYQLVTVRRDGFTRYARQYALGQHRWIGDNRISASGGDWRDTRPHPLTAVDAAFPPPDRRAEEDAGPDGPGPGKSRTAEYRTGGLDADDTGASGRKGGAGARLRRRDDRLAESGPDAELLGRVAEATRVRFPGATVTERPEGSYLRVSHPLPEGGADQQPVGVIDGQATEAAIDAFADQVHVRFASADPSVRSELVHTGPPAPSQLVERARRRGVRLRSLIDYQGLLDLRPLAEAQQERLAADRIYPARLYVPQRFRVVSGGEGEIRSGLIEQAVTWLGADDARLGVVLGDFGRGKTSFLRQLSRVLPAELPGLQPILVELRGLEKAPTLDELLSQYLVRQGVDDISPTKLRYMIHSGRVGLLFDGFDELELRVGYDNAADYLRVLLESVTGRAKVVLTSRTQHFQSTGQVMTALGARVGALAASRVVVLEDFSEDQILAFLDNLFGNEARARARFELLQGIGNLLDLARNPRMLSFVAEMEESRLRAVQGEEGRVSAADLYREIIDFWLAGEVERQQHRHGLPSLDKDERLSACTRLALRLWASKDPTIALSDLSAEVSATLTRLAERGYTEEQASHSIGSGSLLIRTEDGAFAFVHQSIMEWLVADAAARSLDQPDTKQVLTTRRMSRVMAEFFTDLAGYPAARDWATRTLADPGASEAAKQNGLAVLDRTGKETASTEPGGQNLTGVDLRSQDLTGRDLRGANLRRANLRGMRLRDTDLTDADLTGADLTGARLIRGSLAGAVLTESHWSRAALLGTEIPSSLLSSAQLAVAAVVGRDPADAMIQPSGPVNCVAFSKDGSLLAVGVKNAVVLANAFDGRAIRVLQDHVDTVHGVAFSRDGTQLATASDDRTARIWDLATGTCRAILEGHNGSVNSAAFSPDGTQLATGSDDGTTRIWDVEKGVAQAVLAGFSGAAYAVLTADGYKVEGDTGGGLWWAVKLCRFEPGELDEFVPGLRRVPAGEPLPLVGGAGKPGR
jgi:3',5'-cyclic AMP phosphodiesterase CpdA